MTLRTRLTALATAAVLAVLIAAALGILGTHERALIHSVDEQLNLAATTYTRDHTLVAPADDDSIAQLVRDGGVVDVAPTDRAPARAITMPLAPTPPDDRTRLIRSVSGVREGEGAYRVLSTTLPDGGVLHLAASLDDVRESIAALQRALAVAVPLVVVALGVLMWWLIGRTLRPVEAIRAEVAEIGAHGLHRRVPVGGTDDEVSRLAHTMNAMLDRLQRGAEQQRRFIADASHELRSPLARMRAELEVDLAHPTGADLVATHQSALDEVIGLQDLVDDLLDLARGAPSAGPAVGAAVDLDNLVLEAVDSGRGGGAVRFDTTAVGVARVDGDPGQLRRLVANLLDNAQRHAAGTVSVSLRDDGQGRVELVVADDGPGIAAADRDRVFEPFTRLDEARTAHTGGTGLGLAIVRDIAVGHHGTVAIDDGTDGGARVMVTLPTSAGGSAPRADV